MDIYLWQRQKFLFCRCLYDEKETDRKGSLLTKREDRKKKMVGYKKNIKCRPDNLCAIIFTLCLSVRSVEYFLIETDKTVIGENILHKVVGILLLAGALKSMDLKWRDIGFQRNGFLSGVLMGIGYMLLSGVMGIKWGLLYHMTGNIWAGLGDHFLNNTVATNMLHVVSQNGADELQIVRVMAAQLISFALVLAIYCRRNRKRNRF